MSVSPEMRMKGHVAFVTGAASGIGLAAAEAFAAQGADVMLADVNPQGEVEAARIGKKYGVRTIFQRCDVAKESDVKGVTDRTVRDLGRLDYAFNNAGIEGQVAPTDESSIENWDKVVNTNLKGVWLCMKFEIEKMLKQGGGSIVNCSSIAGIVGFTQLPAYVASKHGVVGLTESAALEYATKGIRVNAVCPGIIQTPMFDRFTGGDPSAVEAMKQQAPMGRTGEPKEIADAVIWLSSNKASYVTGQAIAIDGGWTAK